MNLKVSGHNQDYLKNKKGFTMVELIIAIAIMSIVFAAIFRLMDFGVKSTAYGNEKADEQGQLRLVGLRVTDELRNVFKLDLTTSASASPGIAKANHFAIYQDTSGVVFENIDTSTKTSLSGDLVTDIGFKVTEKNDKVVLLVKIDGLSESLETEVLLNNITTVNNSDIVGTDILEDTFSDSLLGWQDKVWFSQDVGDKD